MARLAPDFAGDGNAGMGQGGPDLVTTVDWYRQFPARKLDGWLTAGKVRDIVAFGPGHAFRAVSGGYVAAKADRVYRFPLSVVDLRTGRESAATLNVPYKGELPLPTTNAWTVKDKTQATGPHLLGVTQMHVDGGTLEVTLGMEGTSTGVSFDVSSLATPAPR